MKSQGVQERRETFHHTEDSNGEEEPHGEHTKHENDLDNEVAVGGERVVQCHRVQDL